MDKRKTFDFYDLDQKPKEVGLKVYDWLDRKESREKILIYRNSRDIDGFQYVDAYEELTPEEEYYATLNVPREVLHGWSFRAGVGLGRYLPLYAYSKETNLSEYKSGLFMLDSVMKNKDLVFGGKVLFDTGASMCHITSISWIRSGLAKQFLEENKELCKAIGINKVEDFGKVRDLSAKNLGEDSFLLPLQVFFSGVGDGRKKRAYQIRIDELRLQGSRLGGGEVVVLKNVDFRIIESNHFGVILGENVIQYLTTQMGPIDGEFKMIMDFTEEGERLMEKHREEKGVNAMTTSYFYIEREEKFAISKSFSGGNKSG